MMDDEPPLEVKKLSKTGAVVGSIKEVEINKLIGYEVKKNFRRKRLFSGNFASNYT